MESLGCFLPPRSSTFPGRLLWGRMDSVVWEGLIAEADALWNCISSVINELDGLAKGQETDHRAGGYARVVQEKARKSIEFLERRFESRDSCLRALTSRGNELESIAFRSEDITGQLVRPLAEREIASLQIRVPRSRGPKEGQSTGAAEGQPPSRPRNGNSCPIDHCWHSWTRQGMDGRGSGR